MSNVTTPLPASSPGSAYHPAALEAMVRIEMGQETPTDLYWADPSRLLTDAGFHPDPWQADLLRSTDPRTLLLCHRQAGKSTVAAAMAVLSAILEFPATVLLL